MIKSSLNDYGHPGEAQYDSERHEWVFTRRLGQLQHLRLLEGPEFTLVSNSAPKECNTQQPARARNKAVRQVESLFPETTAAANLLRTELQSSLSIEKLHAAYDPSESDLLAIGHAVDIDGKALKKIPLAAIPGGVTRGKVILVKLREEHLGWQGRENVVLSSTTLRKCERVIWDGQRGPIKQVLFSSDAAEGRVWLAVRFNTATVLLRPAFSVEENLASLFSPFGTGQVGAGNSRIQPNESVDVPIGRTGGANHSDVAFNPFTPDQIAIIDQRGCWSILRLRQHRLQPGLWDVQIMTSGHVGHVEEQNANASRLLEDGFGRIGWVRDSRTLFAVSRTAFVVFGIQEGVKQLAARNVVTTENTEYFLDAKQDSTDNSFIYVVTSTRILLLEIYTNSSPDGTDCSARARVLLAWRHFRSIGDMSLKISVCRTSESTAIILSSRATGLKTINHLYQSSSITTLPHSISNSSLLSLCSPPDDVAHPTTTNFWREERTLSLMMRKVYYENEINGDDTSPNIGDAEDQPSLYRIFVLNNDLSLGEYLFSDSIDQPLTPPNIRRLAASSQKSAKTVTESFVVPDSTIEDESDGIERDIEHQLLDSSALSEIEGSVQQTTLDPWTLNLEWLQQDTPTIKDNSSDVFNDQMESLKSQVSTATNQSETASQSLLELLDFGLAIDDVDTASNDLRDALYSLDKELGIEDHNNGAQYQKIIRKTITPELSRRVGFGDGINLSQLYDLMVHFWVRPLPLHSPGRMRLLAEQFARRIAAESSLACHIVISAVRSKDSLDRDQDALGQDQFMLPLRRKPSNAFVAHQSGNAGKAVPGLPNDDAELQELSLPTPELTPSLRSRSSTSSMIAVESLASQRLGLVVPVSSQTYSDSTIKPITAHWDASFNPDLYDWEGIEHAIAAEDDADGIDESLKSRKKRRKKDRRERLPDPIVEASSQPVPLTTASQPYQSIATQESTQASESIIMSQAEPRPRGSRKSFAKKIKPKRKAGF